MPRPSLRMTTVGCLVARSVSAGVLSRGAHDAHCGDCRAPAMPTASSHRHLLPAAHVRLLAFLERRQPGRSAGRPGARLAAHHGSIRPPHWCRTAARPGIILNATAATQKPAPKCVTHIVVYAAYRAEVVSCDLRSRRRRCLPNLR